MNDVSVRKLQFMIRLYNEPKYLFHITDKYGIPNCIADMCETMTDLWIQSASTFSAFHYYYYCILDGTNHTQINKVIAHPTLPIIITAHEDKYIRFFDVKSG